MSETFTIYFDGGADNNPGPASFGVVVTAADGTAIVTHGDYIGDATNNIAEYSGLVYGLKKAIELNISSVRVVGDSQLVINQMKGLWKVKNEGLKSLHATARELTRKFQKVEFVHTPREHNLIADKLSRIARRVRGPVDDVE